MVWAHLQILGTFMAGFAAFGGFVVTLLNRGPILIWIRSRVQLIAERNVAIRQAQQALDRAKVSEQTAADYAEGLKALRARLDEIDKKLEARNLEVAQVRADFERVSLVCDAMFDYLQRMIDHASKVTERGRKAGADFADLPMPIVPSILADRFGLPQSLRSSLHD